MLNRKLWWSLLAALFVSSSQAFLMTPRATSTRVSPLQATNNNKLVQMATTVAVVISSSPLVALAEEDYEYGAVSAPIGLAWGAGVLAILTALLPVLLQGGEEAFEDMKERDKDSFGSKNSDVLKSRKK